MNKSLLKIEMIRSGYTAETLSKALCMNRSTFSRKINGRAQFTQSEIAKIISILHIDNPSPIFFAEEVS